MVADVFREQLRLSRERKRLRRREEGREEGRREERARWQAWLARMQAAELDGGSFDEPPPGGGGLADARVLPRYKAGMGPRPLACLWPLAISR